MKSKIGIPNPCTEDWSKMAPTSRGAFCDKCQFDVIDFSNMEPEEIRATLKARSGQKTCGHISSVQLDLLNSNYHLWDNQSVSIFRSKFLYACMLAFGLTLFTGCESVPNDYEDIEKVGDVEDVDLITEDDSTTSCDYSIEVENGMLVEGMMEEIQPINEDDGFTLSTELKGNIIGH